MVIYRSRFIKSNHVLGILLQMWVLDLPNYTLVMQKTIQHLKDHRVVPKIMLPMQALKKTNINRDGAVIKQGEIA